MWVSLPGESHALGYRNGVKLLAKANDKFAVEISTSGPIAYSDQYLRFTGIFWNASKNRWGGGASEATYWAAGTDGMHSTLDFSKNGENKLAAVGFCNSGIRYISKFLN